MLRLNIRIATRFSKERLSLSLSLKAGPSKTRERERERERRWESASVHRHVGDIMGEEHDNYPEVGNATPNNRLDGTNSWENEKRGENRD